MDDIYGIVLAVLGPRKGQLILLLASMARCIAYCYCKTIRIMHILLLNAVAYLGWYLDYVDHWRVEFSFRCFKYD